MLQNLIRSAIVVTPETARGRAFSRPPAPATPAGSADPDLGECSLDTLAELADLAYRTGDLAFAEHCVRRLYALYDSKAAAAKDKAGACKARRQRQAERVQDEPS